MNMRITGEVLSAQEQQEAQGGGMDMGNMMEGPGDVSMMGGWNGC